MDTIILAGGTGTRMGEVTKEIPKPLVNIGDKPIIHHIIDHYCYYGHKTFIVCVGYLSTEFHNYFRRISETSLIIDDEATSYLFSDIRITVLDTGLTSGTCKRINKALEYISGSDFFLTYGDGLSNINVEELFIAHKRFNGVATLTAVHPPAQFGRLILGDENRVTQFNEKVIDPEYWINGGYMVLNQRIKHFIDPQMENFEKDVLPKVAISDLLFSYKHVDFWQCMDTAKDHEILETMWRMNKAPWIHPI